jgi:hypothetical protein
LNLLRRAPRTVYRVFDEEEYLSGSGEEECFTAPASGARDRRLRRAASAAMLVGTVSAIGGLVTLSDVWPVRGSGRRPGVGLRDLAGALVSPHAAGTHDWRERERARRPREGTGAAGVAVRARGPVQPSGRRRAPGRSAPAPALRAPTDTALVALARSTVGQSVPLAHAGRAEFGFERAES